jgi:hypothetical protein
MKTLTLNNSFDTFYEQEDEAEIAWISSLVYSDTKDRLLQLSRFVLNRFDAIVNQLNSLFRRNSKNTIFWLSDHYGQNVMTPRNSRIYRELTLTNLVKGGRYLESVSLHKPKYMILNVSGADFLMPDRIQFMIQQLSNGSLEKTEVFDIVTIVLKKSLQKLYYSVQMLSPDTIIVCQELSHPKKWVNQLVKYGIIDEIDRINAVQKLSKAFCNVIKETADKYDHFTYEGCNAST